MSRRLGVLGVLMVALFLIIAGQAAYLQFWRAGALDKSSLNPRVTNSALQYARGTIYAANGQVLAKSIPSGHSDYPWRRVYPLGALTAGVVGFSSNYYGTWGLEAEYNTQLSAHRVAAQSWAQVLSPEYEPDSLSLTLEPELQKIARSALGGKDGAVVALDPSTGAVLAMYGNPSYNPNLITLDGPNQEKVVWDAYNKPDSHDFPPLANIATQQTFPPGSTFKVITTAGVVAHKPSLFTHVFPSTICLSLKPYDSDQKLCNDGYTLCGGTIAVMLPESCDPGYALVGYALGGDDLAAEAGAFGYNANIPIDLPGVVKSFFPSKNAIDPDIPELMYSAIGQQDVRTTALQNALVASAIADGGIMMTPHLLASITSPSNEVVPYKPRAWRRSLSSAQAAQIVPLMHDVVTEGTAYYVGFLPQDDVAAKTGTAQTGPHGQETDDWMIAFAPASHPVIAVAVVVPYQTASVTGAEIAGPIVKCMIEGAIAMDNNRPATNTSTTCPS